MSDKLSDQQLQYIRNWLELNPPHRFKLDRLLNLLYFGSGDPEGVITASPGSLYLNEDGGASTTLYVKESGTNTDTGWIAK